MAVKKLVNDPEQKLDMDGVIKATDKMVIDYLLVAGWKHCWNPATKSMLWINIYSSNYDGKCYAVPKVYMCEKVFDACVIQGKWETSKLPIQM